MSAESALVVNRTVTIPRSELTFRATRAGGPGGQHVNTSSTRVELVWNPGESRAVSDDERSRLVEKLAARLDASGNVRVVASASRSQLQNRRDAEVKLATLIRRALVVPKVRRTTRPTRASVEARLQSKRKMSDKKRERRRGQEID